jgi:hypothetical protein
MHTLPILCTQDMAEPAPEITRTNPAGETMSVGMSGLARTQDALISWHLPIPTHHFTRLVDEDSLAAPESEESALPSTPSAATDISDVEEAVGMNSLSHGRSGDEMTSWLCHSFDSVLFVVYVVSSPCGIMMP